MQELALIVNNLRFFIKKELDEIEHGSPEEPRRLTTLALYFRCLGIAKFLAFADRNAFVDYLGRGIAARLDYLERLSLRQATESDVFNTIPKNRALFDAVAIGADDAATKLARLCNDGRNVEKEYEEEFLYARFFHLAHLAGPDLRESDELSETLERLRALIGDDDARVTICSSLIESDSAKFETAMLALIEQRSVAFAERKDLHPAIKQTESHLFVQGLAMAKIARRTGIELRLEYPTMPRPLMELPVAGATIPANWRSVD